MTNREAAVQLSEHDIQDQILDWLKGWHVFCYRQNTGMAKLKGGFWVRFGKPGAPDIVAVLNGRFIGIEVKKPGAKQSESQSDYQRELERAGGLYILAFSLEHVTQAFAQLGRGSLAPEKP